MCSMGSSLQLSLSLNRQLLGRSAADVKPHNNFYSGAWHGTGTETETKIERVSRDIPWDELGVTTTLVFLNTTHLTRKEHQPAGFAGWLRAEILIMRAERPREAVTY